MVCWIGALSVRECVSDGEEEANIFLAMDLPIFGQFAPCAYLPLPLCDVYRATTSPATMITNMSMMDSIGAPPLRWVRAAGRGYALQWGIKVGMGVAFFGRVIMPRPSDLAPATVTSCNVCEQTK